MTKQEEIAQGLQNIIADFYCEQGVRVCPEEVVGILTYLHSQGVAIKVDIEAGPRGTTIGVCEYFEPLI